MNISPIELKQAQKTAQTLENRFERDARYGIISYPDLQETVDPKSQHRWDEMVLANRYADELEAIQENKHEAHLDIVAYEQYAKQEDEETIRSLLREHEWSRWKVGAAIRESEKDGKGIDSKYSVVLA